MQAKWWLLITHWHIFNCINSSNETILKWSSIQTLVGLASRIFRSSYKATLERETQALPPTLWIKYTRALINTAMVKILQVVKNPPAKAGELRDAGLIPGSERSPGGEHGNPLQYSCLENPMDRGAWWATVHGVAKAKRWLSTAHTVHLEQGQTRVPSPAPGGRSREEVTPLSPNTCLFLTLSDIHS